MSKFILPYDNMAIAAQVAALINSGGQLVIHQTPQSVLNGPVTYMLDMHKDKVIGTMGLVPKSKDVSEMKHLCVHPDYRRQGIGLKLLEKGIRFAKTEKVYGLVRADNSGNIRNNIRAGLRPVAKYWGRNCYIIVFVGRKKHDRRARA